MKKMGLHEVRKAFLDFFKSKEHFVAKSYSLVPKGDKSLLLIGAGMAPLKKYFTGELVPPARRMATCQKCMRTGDIENVGLTSRHATFFEMLGNFSFGDYFKEEAITWAWEFLTEVLELDPERLWVTVYKDDDEAFKIWHEKVGLPTERIERLGQEDNFWELEVGPSGPDTEIFYDRGEEYGNQKSPGEEGERFLEVWNLVFTQYDKDEKGNYNRLKHPNIDTGMGLERITCVMEGVDTIFDIEAIGKIIKEIEKISGKKYGEDEKTDISIRVITDHIRAMTFMVSDGILPSNEERGYVLRRIIRRAIRHGKLIGIEENFLTKIAEIVIEDWKAEYENLGEKKYEILNIINAEEEKFNETLNQGLDILKDLIENLKKSGNKTLSGEDAFKLYDTFGFPYDLTVEILKEEGMDADKKGFDVLMEEQRERARANREVSDMGWSNIKFDEEIKESPDTVFDGYTLNAEKALVAFILKDGEQVESLKAGDEGTIILNRTPFYGESGGQVGDKGILKSENFFAEVSDTQKQNDKFLHIVKIKSGEIKKGDEIYAEIDEERRNFIRKNHSATHLLDQALKDVLGDHVSQAGSIVYPDKFRFDFTHFKAMTEEEIRKTEEIVNREIFNAMPVETNEMAYNKAVEKGAIGLFEDKYKSEVRVVSMGDYSMELCGGTHVSNTQDIGIFKIVQESGIAAGVRRIEAITSRAVYKYILEKDKLLNDISVEIKADEDKILERVSRINEELKQKDKQLREFSDNMAKAKSEEIIKNAEEINGVKLIASDILSMNMEELRNTGDKIKSEIPSSIIILGSVYEGKPYLMVMGTNDAVEKGFHAGNLIKEAAKIMGGGGGGRPNMAQAGGKNPEKLKEALSEAKKIAVEQIK